MGMARAGRPPVAWPPGGRLPVPSARPSHREPAEAATSRRLRLQQPKLFLGSGLGVWRARGRQTPRPARERALTASGGERAGWKGLYRRWMAEERNWNVGRYRTAPTPPKKADGGAGAVGSRRRVVVHTGRLLTLVLCR